MNAFFTQCRWDHQFQWFEAERAMDDVVLRFLIEAESEHEEDVLDKALHAFIRFGSNFGALMDYISRALYATARDDWYSSLTEAQFQDALTMDVFRYQRNGRVEVMFDAGDIFGDHRIRLVLDASCQPCVASISY